MAVVLEVLNRSGQILKYQAFDQHQVSVGRAYKNDFVISDHYVDPFHMTIRCLDGAEQFECLDLGSVNGIVHNKKVQPVINVDTGSQLVLGKTVLRISSIDQAVTPALPLSFWEFAADALSRWWWAAILVLLLVSAHTFDTLINNPLVKHKSALYSSVLYMFVWAAVCAGFYAFLARILRHDTRFLLYFNIALCALILHYLYDFVEPILVVNISSAVLSKMISVVFIGALLWAFVYVSLRYASHLNAMPRGLIACLLPIVVAVASFPDVFEQEDRFQAVPPYDPVVVSGTWYWHEGATTQHFLEAAQGLYVQEVE